MDKLSVKNPNRDPKGGFDENTDYIVCKICEGVPKFPCEICLGTGVIEQVQIQKILFVKRKFKTEVACPRCNGERFIMCPNCNGLGMVPRT